MTQHIQQVIVSSKVCAEDDRQTINYRFSHVCAGVTEQSVLVVQFTQTVHKEDSQNNADLESTPQQNKILFACYYSLPLLDK